MMTRKEFWKWLALCPAPEGYSEDSGYFIAEDNGDESLHWTRTQQK